jgi:hypothetical protein
MCTPFLNHGVVVREVEERSDAAGSDVRRYTPMTMSFPRRPARVR